METLGLIVVLLTATVNNETVIVGQYENEQACLMHGAALIQTNYKSAQDYFNSPLELHCVEGEEI